MILDKALSKQRYIKKPDGKTANRAAELADRECKIANFAALARAGLPLFAGKRPKFR